MGLNLMFFSFEVTIMVTGVSISCALCFFFFAVFQKLASQLWTKKKQVPVFQRPASHY